MKFALKLMNSALKMMNSAFNMMNFASTHTHSWAAISSPAVNAAVRCTRLCTSLLNTDPPFTSGLSASSLLRGVRFSGAGEYQT